MFSWLPFRFTMSSEMRQIMARVKVFNLYTLDQGIQIQFRCIKLLLVRRLKMVNSLTIISFQPII
jgi:hypothetical protein